MFDVPASSRVIAALFVPVELPVLTGTILPLNDSPNKHLQVNEALNKHMQMKAAKVAAMAANSVPEEEAAATEEQAPPPEQAPPLKTHITPAPMPEQPEIPERAPMPVVQDAPATKKPLHNFG